MPYSKTDDFEYFNKYTTRLSFRKKPKGFDSRNNPWLNTADSNNLNDEIEDRQAKKGTLRNTISHMSIENRIRFYEEKYVTCMCSETELSAWIRSIKGKGKPEPLTEGYIPPARSKLSDFFHYALSTKQRKRKATPNHVINTPAPAPKSSLSTFLKKATDSISTTYKSKKQQPKERIISGPAPILHTKDNTLNQSTRNRFSITSSLTRFSLSSKNNTLLRNTLVQVEEDNDISANGSTRLFGHYKSLKQRSRPSDNNNQASAVPSELQNKTLSSLSAVDHQNKTIDTNILLKKSKKPRFQATILPHSPSSIFLDKLQPSSSSSNREIRSSTLSKRPKSAKSQNCHSYILHNDSAHFSNCDIIQDNSTKVVKTPPIPAAETALSSISTPSITKNRKKEGCQNVDLKPSRTTVTVMILEEENGLKSKSTINKRQKSLLRTISSRRNRNSVDKKEETVKNNGEYHSILAARSHQKKPRPEEQGKEKSKKKRGSILAAPSLSTLRLLSQKTQALKRQSLRT